MAQSRIRAVLRADIRTVWDTVLAVGQYGAWRSDVSRTEVRGERQFVEYTKDGYATAFTVTMVEPYQRWAFTMENTNMTGHWTGVFAARGDATEIEFTEQAAAKKFWMKPFVKAYLQKQQRQFVRDLQAYLSAK